MPAPAKHFLTLRQQQREAGAFKGSLSPLVQSYLLIGLESGPLKELTNAAGVRVLVTNALNDNEWT